MPVDSDRLDRDHAPSAGFRPSPPGLVRDLRIRWALEEIGRPYRVRLLDAMNPRPADYFLEQPFGQVPAYRDDEVQLFESGAILIHLGLQDERLLPADREWRGCAAIAWLIAALNSVEPMIFELINIDIFNRGQDWTEGAPAAGRREDRRAAEAAGRRARRQGLARRPLHDRRPDDGQPCFATCATPTSSPKHPNLAAFVARGEARPAFQRALADQLAFSRIAGLEPA